jgi:hypothetical protein
MGRKKGAYKPKRLPLTLIEPTHSILENLVKTGAYGNNATDAARIIIMSHIQSLETSGKISVFAEDVADETDPKK